MPSWRRQVHRPYPVPAKVLLCDWLCGCRQQTGRPRPLAPHAGLAGRSQRVLAMSHPPAACVPSSSPQPPTSVPSTAVNADPRLGLRDTVLLSHDKHLKTKNLFGIILEFPLTINVGVIVSKLK